MKIFKQLKNLLMLGRVDTVPVFLSGMWSSLPGDPESGTRVSLIEKEGGPIILSGFSDEYGDFRGRLPSSWIGKKVYVVVREPGFKYKYFNPIKVEKWGVFLPIHQEKDLVYSGLKGAKSIDPIRWANWNSTQEHIRATKRVNEAVRKAKIAWPLRPLGFVVALIVGVVGFFVHPVIGLIAGILSFISMEFLAQFLLNKGF
jgi:hypothetical protein